jgi:nucleoside-diphosphate-sugar epimerase
MRIFLTGGSGYTGSSVLDAFVRAGHHVDALVRTPEKAAEVQARGGKPLLGDLTSPASYADAAAAADGIVHAALAYSTRGEKIDAAALDVFLALPLKRGRFMIYTSAVWVLGNCLAPADETAPVNPAELAAWRPAHEDRVLGIAAVGGRPIVVRPGLLYGGSRGIVGDVFKDAANSLIRIVGSGENHWPLIYDRDLAELYVRLAASPDASGIFHANDEGDERVNDIVAAVAAHAKTRPSIRHLPLAEARKKMGAYAEALALDQIVRSPRARALGWSPSLHSVGGNAARLFEEWRRGKEAA